jgi:hypothetical protein
MNLNISTIATAVLIPLFVPFISVYFAFIITKKHNEKEYFNNQRIQRIKLLTLLKKEAEMYKSYRIQKNTHRSKEFISIKLVINSPAFNVEEHAKLIELALEMARLNQNIEIAVNALTGLLSTTLGGYISNLSTGNPILLISNSRQVAGAIGIAVMVSILSAKQGSYLATITNEPTQAAVTGSSLVFTISLVLAVINIVLSLFMKNPINLKTKCDVLVIRTPE